MGVNRLLAEGKPLARLHAISAVYEQGRHFIAPYAMALTATLAISAGSFMAAANAASTHAPLRHNAATSSGSCTFKKTEYATADSYDESTSQNFVNLGDAGSITFTQNGTGCVAGTFFANAGNAAAGDHVGLQVLLDGIACVPLTKGYIFADTEFSSHSAGFFCGAGIAAGTHTIQVQYHSGFGGNALFFQRTLVVEHT